MLYALLFVAFKVKVPVKFAHSVTLVMFRLSTASAEKFTVVKLVYIPLSGSCKVMTGYCVSMRTLSHCVPVLVLILLAKSVHCTDQL